RELAARHQYPAVDVLHSVSRLMSQLVDREHLEAAARFRRLYAAYRDGEDLLRIGAYREGSDPELDEALRRWDSLQSYLRQETGEAVSLAAARRQLLSAVGMGEDA